MSICKHIISPASLGEYELHVTQVGSSDSIHGFRFVDGVEIESWEHSDLVAGSPRTFTVGEEENHSVNVIGTIVGDDKFLIDLQHDGESLGDCELKKSGDTSANFGIVGSSGA